MDALSPFVNIPACCRCSVPVWGEPWSPIHLNGHSMSRADGTTHPSYPSHRSTLLPDGISNNGIPCKRLSRKKSPCKSRSTDSKWKPVRNTKHTTSSSADIDFFIQVTSHLSSEIYSDSFLSEGKIPPAESPIMPRDVIAGQYSNNHTNYRKRRSGQTPVWLALQLFFTLAPW